jgi:uncharacterized protein (DUF433 family)
VGGGLLPVNALPPLSKAQLRYHHDVQHFDRITMDPEVMGGKPCIRGMRVTVGMIVEAMAQAGPSKNCWLISPI